MEGPKEWLDWGCKIYSSIEMKSHQHDEQPGNTTLGFVFANIAYMKRFLQPDANDQALYDRLLLDGFGPVLGQLWGTWKAIVGSIHTTEAMTIAHV